MTVQLRSYPILAWTARCWFAVTVAGQLLFAAYIAVLYGGAAAAGNLAAWNTVMTHGHVAGDSGGNTATGLHLLVAALVMLAGALQLVPAVRARAPALHRWNGRLYVAGAVIGSVTGIYMMWWRGAVGDVVQHLGTTANGLVIVFCAGMAVWRIRGGQVPAHRAWALRLFIAVGGVWFFRVGLMFWLAAHGGPAGFDPATFRGPFLSFLAFGQFLVPLAILELYLRCREGGALVRAAMSALLALVTAMLAVGIAVAAAGMWLPRM
jgi:hypothetical protein